MKKLFLSLAALAVAAMSYAQSNLVATLSHEGEISVFHGSNSLIDAMAAADHGDIITLASGRYNAVTINKAITLRGAGIESDDTSTGTARTEIVGNFDINISSTEALLTIEGIYHDGTIDFNSNLNNATIQKCRLKYIGNYYSYYTINSLTVIHCKIASTLALPVYSKSSAKFISCIVNSPKSCGNGNNGSMEFTNCIITGELNSTHQSYYQNCILNGTGTLNSTNTASYCAGYTSDAAGSPFANISTKASNKVLTQEQIDALFESTSTYELTDAAKAEYVGIDGKEMGIYGGNLPFETRILSPQITKCNVAAKTTADGKLSVDIEVKAAE